MGVADVQQERLEDVVLATGVTTYIEDFVMIAFAEIRVELKFSGSEENEIDKVKSNEGE